MQPRIIFMGTPAFAVASLDKIINAGYNVVAVITSPDKPAGRGMQITQSEVKKYAEAKGLYILQPVNLKHPDFIDELKSLKADLQIVVAFRMLPEMVWNMPPMGTINVHGSLLPQYRGAAPINWAIINGEKFTGVTTFKLQHQIDTGNILHQRKIEIGPDETAGELHDRMKIIGADLLLKTVNELFDNKIEEVPQQQIQETELKHAPKIFTETCKINWHAPVAEIHNFIRGLSPYPGAFTFLNEKKLKIFSSMPEVDVHKDEPGTIHSDGTSYLKFAANNGWIQVLDLQLEGKKRMPVLDFLRGNKVFTK